MDAAISGPKSSRANERGLASVPLGDPSLDRVPVQHWLGTRLAGTPGT
jgi:hypothetical protein